MNPQINDPTTPTIQTKHDIAELEKLYMNADSCDQELFAEMRSNLLLVAGDHYTRKNSRFYKRIQDSKDLTEQQKVRLTKNHVGAIHKRYANNVTGLLPGVGFEPKNQSSLQDQKTAELHHSVWEDCKIRYNLEERNDEWCDDFFGIGEVATKIFWDPNAGELKGFMQAVGDDGQPQVDDQGQMVADKAQPVYTGAFVFEEIYGFNLLRDPDAKSMRKSTYLIHRKMVQVDELKRLYGNDPDKLKLIQPSSDRTYVIFDITRGGYRKTNSEVLVKEYFFRPSPLYPMGYFYIATTEGILDEGELPGGIFPIVWQYCDRLPTSPRGRGPVKQMRPYQAEINRAASKMAEHQITLGDDKLLIQNGTKISPGIALPGVRSINYTGMEPGILGGRDGSQYLAYMQAQIEELYQVMMVADDDAPAQGQVDPNALLFAAASRKKRFSRYIKRFERYLVEIAKTYNSLAKVHLPDDAIVYAVGSSEMVNIQEFRNAKEIHCQVKITSQAEDIETKMGQQLVLNHVLQFVGPQLGKDDIGKLIRAMPYANVEESFNDLTLDYDVATNDILALDRGQMPQYHDVDNHTYILKRLAARMRQPDFDFLPPNVKTMYQQVMSQHAQAEADQAAALQRAESGFIPTDGYLITCQMYVADPADPQKTRLARVPYTALSWLIKKLEDQGQGLEQLEQMDQGAMAQVANHMPQQQPGMVPPNGMGGAVRGGPGMPPGVAHGYGNPIVSGPRPGIPAGQPGPSSPQFSGPPGFPRR